MKKTSGYTHTKAEPKQRKKQSAAYLFSTKRLRELLVDRFQSCIGCYRKRVVRGSLNLSSMVEMGIYVLHANHYIEAPLSSNRAGIERTHYFRDEGSGTGSTV